MSTPKLDLAAVERAARGLALRTPRTPQRGKIGEVRSSSTGSSMELHDFRLYHPGDDLRQLDWNAVARTGELVLRVRQDEVSPRIEVVVDASRSMEVSDAKGARTREVALLLCLLAQRSGLDTTLLTVGTKVQRVRASQARSLLGSLELDGREPFPDALKRAPPLLPCGVRILVSDLLFESPAQALAERLARGTSMFGVVQVLDGEDIDPTGGLGARLTDSESGEILERMLTGGVLADYQRKLEAHLSLWDEAARRVRGTLTRVSADATVDSLARRELLPLMEAA